MLHEKTTSRKGGSVGTEGLQAIVRVLKQRHNPTKRANDFLGETSSTNSLLAALITLPTHQANASRKIVHIWIF